MMNEELQKFLDDLSPELQQKARECKTQEEFNDFFSENDIELPDEILDAVSGGCNIFGVSESATICPMGGKHEFEYLYYDSGHSCKYYRCTKCKEVIDEPVCI